MDEKRARIWFKDAVGTVLILGGAALAGLLLVGLDGVTDPNDEWPTILGVLFAALGFCLSAGVMALGGSIIVRNEHRSGFLLRFGVTAIAAVLFTYFVILPGFSD